MALGALAGHEASFAAREISAILSVIGFYEKCYSADCKIVKAVAAAPRKYEENRDANHFPARGNSAGKSCAGGG